MLANTGDLRVSELVTCVMPFPAPVENPANSMHVDMTADANFMVYANEFGPGSWNIIHKDPLGCSLAVTPAVAPAQSREPVIADGGLRVAFTSSVALTANDTNAFDDVYVADVDPLTFVVTLSLVSVGTGGVSGNGPSRSPSISSDGTLVAFVSDATDMQASDTDPITDVFVRDIAAATTSLEGRPGSGFPSTNPDLVDGTLLAFENDGDVYLQTLGLPGTVIAAGASSPSLSGDQFSSSDWIAYVNGSGFIEVQEIATGQTTADVMVPGLLPDISVDGRYVAFVGVADSRVYTFDNFTRVSVMLDTGGGLTTDPSGTFGLRPPAISTDGTRVSFATTSVYPVVPLDSGAFQDIYRRCPIGNTTFCNGDDGSLASCPCPTVFSNDFAGCDIPLPAMGGRAPGVSLVPTQQNVSAASATLVASGFPTSSSPGVTIFRNPSLVSPVVFGDGIRCIGVPVVRLAATTASGGISTHVISHGAMAGTGAFLYQAHFRSNPASFCDPTAAFNLSSGTVLVW